MKRLPTIKIARLLMSLLLLTNFLTAYASTEGGVPLNVLPPNGWQNIMWQDSSNWVTMNVTEYGLQPNDSHMDATEKIMDLINGTSGNRILYFPEGTYYLKTRLEITTSNIILKGDGAHKTEFLIDTPSIDNGTILFNGDPDFDAPSGSTIPVINSPSLGDKTLTVSDTSSLNEGDMVYLYLQNGLEHWGTYTESQIVKIESIQDNTLYLDMNLGLDFPASQTPVIQKLNMVENIGIQDLKIYRTRAADNNNTSNIEMKLVYNGFVKNIESSYSERAHIITRFSKNLVIERNKIHHSYDYGGGGQGYGIELSSSSTSCRVTDNKLWSLRHHLIIHLGANHNILSYNSLEADYTGTSNPACIHGDYAHNNLFESNYFLKNGISDGVWGADGPRNTWFRNYSGAAIGTYDARDGENTSQQNVIANVMNSLADGGTNHYVAANNINGTINWGQLSETAVIPDSLYLTSKPEFLTDKEWPVYGPGVSDWGVNNSLPAFDRTRDYGSTLPDLTPGDDLILDENFNGMTTGNVPTDWIVNDNHGTITIADMPTATNKSMMLYDDSTSGGITGEKYFAAQTSIVAAEFDMLLPTSVDYFNVQLKGDSTSAVSIFFRNGDLAYKKGDGTYVSLQPFNTNTFYHIKIVADASSDKCNIFVDDVLKASNVAFRNPVTSIDNVSVGSPGSNTGVMYVDNIIVYTN